MIEKDDIFRGLGVEIEISSPDDFLKIKETLTRIGIPSNKEKKLYQSCHILHKRGRYAILHFKELFSLDRRKSTLDETDIGRRNSIAKLLEEWELCKILEKEKVQEACPFSKLKIISYADKGNWELVSKYNIGQRKWE